MASSLRWRRVTLSFDKEIIGNNLFGILTVTVNWLIVRLNHSMTPIMIPKMIYGTAWKKERTCELVTKALDAGFRAIDTANQPKHYFEAGVGEAVKKFFKSHSRGELFLQTKFTSLDGQDDRVPYNPEAAVSAQVEESLKSSLDHLGVDYLDSLLLHGPYGHPGLSPADFEVWGTMEKALAEGKTKAIGISNVNSDQLIELVRTVKIKPSFVQNRCFAARGWDHVVRTFCQENDIVYQGFSLLTANPDVVMSVVVNGLAARYSCTAAEIVFAYVRTLSILPLTGTSDDQHMRQDLSSLNLKLDPAELKILKSFAPG